MRRRWWNSLLLLCVLAFAAATWGSVDCGQRLVQRDLAAEDATHLRRLIYFHFALSQLAIVGACMLFYLRHARWKRYYLLVSYNEKGLSLNPPGILMPRGRVYRCSLRSLEHAELPPSDAPVLVYPMMMLSGISSGEKLESALESAYARRGQRPDLYYQPVFGASPWLPKAVAQHLKTRLSPGTGVLIVAHGSTLPEPPPEPRLLCRRLGKLLPRTEIALGYFGQAPSALHVLRSMTSRHILVLPFLLTEGLHTARDLPTPAQAEACGKTIERLPVIASLLDRDEDAPTAASPTAAPQAHKVPAHTAPAHKVQETAAPGSPTAPVPAPHPPASI